VPLLPRFLDSAAADRHKSGRAGQKKLRALVAAQGRR